MMARVLTAAFLVLAAAWLDAASAEESLLARCWTPQALAATAAELKAAHARGKLDLPALRQ